MCGKRDLQLPGATVEYSRRCRVVGGCKNCSDVSIFAIKLQEFNKWSNQMPIKLDRIDKAILSLIQIEGRIPNLDLAERVGLSPSSCLRRVKRLEDSGAIRRYVALLNAGKIGLGITVFSRISLIAQDAETVESFAQAMNALPQVVECHIMAGECDALLRVVARDLDDYRGFQMENLNRKNGVQTVKTDIPMQTVKMTTELPLDNLR